MSSRPLVDPELLPLLESFPTIDFNADNLQPARDAGKAMLSLLPPFPDNISVEEVFIPGPAGAPDVRVKLYRKKDGATSGAKPAILHLHGGGYISGNPEFMGPQCALWANLFDVVVASPAYRLAPETAYPGNVEDAYATLAWMNREAASLGLDTKRIAVTGESAGGGLSAALALLVRDRGEYSFCHQQLIFPMLDDRTAVRTDISPMFGEFIWTNASNHYGWSSLLGQAPGGPDVSPYAAAARAESLAGLPPTFICTGALDLFTEENLEYARRLMTEGVPVELHVYAGAPHAFMREMGARVSRTYMRDALAGMAKGLGVAFEG